jgi:hypothetical protein
MSDTTEQIIIDELRGLRQDMKAHCEDYNCYKRQTDKELHDLKSKVGFRAQFLAFLGGFTPVITVLVYQWMTRK